MTEEQQTNLEAMAEEAFTHWQQTRDEQAAALIVRKSITSPPLTHNLARALSLNG